MEDMVNNHFGVITRCESAVKIDRPPMTPVSDRLKFAQVADTMQSAVKFAIPTIGPDHPDYCDLSLAVTALGGYFGSRLMSNIREDKGYTYGIQSFLTGAADSGLMVIATEADNTYVQPLLTEVISEVKRLATNPVTNDELNRMCNFVLSQAVASLDSPFNIISYYESLKYDSLPADSFRRRMDAVKSINGDRIMSVAAKYLNIDQLKIAVAGDVDAYTLDENIIFH
jgi:predicted Zn-dependent peptidase